jgi:hypothetical protein
MDVMLLDVANVTFVMSRGADATYLMLLDVANVPYIFLLQIGLRKL